MTPSEAAKSIQQRFEQSSGKYVVIDKSNEFRGYATIRIASVDAPAHIFRYKPEFEPELPYLLAFQCGLALRTIESKPENRFDVSSTDSLSIDLQELDWKLLESTENISDDEFLDPASDFLVD